jgi:hypothetical protein
MPPLVCPSPKMLDQSFPRNTDELNIVSTALGEMQRLLKADEIHIILTQSIQRLAGTFEWVNSPSYPLLMEIYTLVSRWFLNPHEGLIIPNLLDVNSYKPHPMPKGCDTKVFSNTWSDEVGKLLVKHDINADRGKFYIGVGCESALCGMTLGSYSCSAGERVFPLVGPKEIKTLDDAYIWKCSGDVLRMNIPLNSAISNCGVLGASHVEPPNGGSHYKAIFPGKQRSWIIDSNYDPVPDKYVRELESITGFELVAIKYALLEGKLPDKVCRI